MRSLVQRAVPVLATVASVGLLSTALQSHDAQSQPAPSQTASQALPPAADIPTPEDFFGFAMGTTGQLADFPSVKEYMSQVADESDRRSEEHTSELQSRGHLVCRLLLEKKKKK